MRICEYCHVKMLNPQIEQFYQLGKLWRQTDTDTVQKKTDWYKMKQVDLKLSVETERESVQLDAESLEREKAQMDQQKNSIMSQTIYVKTEKDRLL